MFSRKDVTLDFGAMDTFIEDILKAIYEHGARAVRVFPPPSQVLIFFSERLANEVVRTRFNPFILEGHTKPHIIK